MTVLGGYGAVGGSQYSIGDPPTDACISPTGVEPPILSNRFRPLYQQTALNAPRLLAQRGQAGHPCSGLHPVAEDPPKKEEEKARNSK